MTYFQSEVNWNWSAGGWGSDSLSVVNLRMETSVLSLFRPSFWLGAACTAGRWSVSTFLHSGFFRSLPAFSHTAFPLDTFVLNRYFSMKLSMRPALFYSLFQCPWQDANCSNKSLAFSLCSHSCCCLSREAAELLFFCKLGTFKKVGV